MRRTLILDMPLNFLNVGFEITKLLRKLLDLDTCFREELHRELIRIGIFVYDARNSAVDDEPRADRAGLVRAVKSCALDGDSKLSRLTDCILLGVYGVAFFSARSACDAKPVAHAIALLATGSNSRRGTVVAGRKYALILDYYGTDRSTFACAARPR